MASMEILITRQSSHCFGRRSGLGGSWGENSGFEPPHNRDFAIGRGGYSGFPRKRAQLFLQAARRVSRLVRRARYGQRRAVACADKDRWPGRKTPRPARRHRSCRRRRFPDCPAFGVEMDLAAAIESPAGRAWNPPAGTGRRPSSLILACERLQRHHAFLRDVGLDRARDLDAVALPRRRPAARRGSARPKAGRASAASAARCSASASITTGMPFCGSRATLASKETGLLSSSCLHLAPPSGRLRQPES